MGWIPGRGIREMDTGEKFTDLFGAPFMDGLVKRFLTPSLQVKIVFSNAKN